MDKVSDLKQTKNAFFSDDEDGADGKEEEDHPLINLQKEAIRYFFMSTAKLKTHIQKN